MKATCLIIVLAKKLQKGILSILGTKPAVEFVNSTSVYEKSCSDGSQLDKATGCIEKSDMMVERTGYSHPQHTVQSPPAQTWHLSAGSGWG